MKPFTQEAFTFAVSIIAALAIFASVAAVRGAFLEPPGGPPEERDIVLPLTVSRDPEFKSGNLQASDVFVRNFNWWASQFPLMERIRALATSSATAYCSPGYTLVSCMGSRHPDAIDRCPEDVCGLVGVIPLGDSGCRVGIDPNTIFDCVPAGFLGKQICTERPAGTTATVDAYCMYANR